VELHVRRSLPEVQRRSRAVPLGGDRTTANSNLKGQIVIDETEAIRRQMVAEVNATPGSRADLEGRHGQVWDTTELQNDFQVLGFAAPFVIA
jgi:hypothetical protein